MNQPGGQKHSGFLPGLNPAAHEQQLT